MLHARVFLIIWAPKYIKMVTFTLAIILEWVCDWFSFCVATGCNRFTNEEGWTSSIWKMPIEHCKVLNTLPENWYSESSKRVMRINTFSFSYMVNKVVSDLPMSVWKDSNNIVLENISLSSITIVVFHLFLSLTEAMWALLYRPRLYLLLYF